MKVLIVGLGAVGGLLSSLAWLKKYDVFCLVRDQTSKEKIGKIIKVKSVYYGNLEAKPEIVFETNDSFDLIILAVKSFSLEQSIQKILKTVSDKTIVLTLLNGLGHREILRNYFPAKTIVGTIGHVEVFLDENRNVIHLNNHPPNIEIASDNESQFGDLDLVYNFFKDIQINVSILPNENDVIWRKLVRLSAIGVVGASSKETLGNILANQFWRELLMNVVKELSAVANSEFVSVDANNVLDQIKGFSPQLKTSLHKDLISGLPSELDSILVKPLKLGLEKGLNMENLEYCYKLIQQNYSSNLN